MTGTHSGEFATFEDSKEFHAGLGKDARDVFCLRTRLCHDTVTDESSEIDLLSLENVSVECRYRWRLACRGRSLVSEKSGRFHRSLLSVFTVALCYVCVNTRLWWIFCQRCICRRQEGNHRCQGNASNGSWKKWLGGTPCGLSFWAAVNLLESDSRNRELSQLPLRLRPTSFGAFGCECQWCGFRLNGHSPILP